MENHRVLSSSEKNSAVKEWRFGGNSVSSKKKHLSSYNNGKSDCFGASLAVVPNSMLLASRCSVECEEEEEVGKKKQKKGVVVVVEEEGSAVLRSAWIQRIIPRVLGDEKDKGKLAAVGSRENQTHESLVGFWKKKERKPFCVVADAGLVSPELSRVRESPSKITGRVAAGCQSWEHDAGADAVGGNNNNKNNGIVIASGNESNAGGGVVVAAGLGFQFDGGGCVGDGGGGSTNRNSRKEREISFADGPSSSLPPLSLFAPFKHEKEWRRRKRNDQGGNNSSSSSGKAEEVVALMMPPPVLTPLLSKDQIVGTSQKRMLLDHLLSSSLTPLSVPSSNPSAIHSIATTSTVLRAADTRLGFGEMFKRPLEPMQVFSPFKSSRDANNAQSPCSSKTASLPFDLVLPLDTDGHDSVKQEDTGAKCNTQPARNINEEHPKLRGSLSANVGSATLVSSSFWPECGNQSGDQESSGQAAEVFRHRSSTSHLLCCDHQPKAQHLKTKEVAIKDPNERRLFSAAGSSGSIPPVLLVVSAPGYQSPFQSASSSTHVKAVGGQNMVVLEGYRNPAMETSQQKPTEKTLGWNCGVEEMHSQELQPEDREIGKEQTREQERGSGAEEAEDVVARMDVYMEQVPLGCGALESGFGSGSGVVHALVQQGSRQGQDVVQRNGTCNLLAQTPDNDRPGCSTSFRKWTCDPSMDVHSRSRILEELNTTPSQACNIPSADNEYPKVPKGQPWLHRWMHPSISRSNDSFKLLSASRVFSGGSGLGAASNADASTVTKSQEGVAYSRRVQKVASEGETSHAVIGVNNQFAKTERGNVSVGEDDGSRSKMPFFLGYQNPPSAAAIALVGAASRRSMMPLLPQRQPGTRVAVWPLTQDTLNSLPHVLPHGS
ncbi:hypothetical protein BDL97_13G110700 [Sphagnum fallax]|nr:hypothetical protein BDL97_13G110700 [Sphagnum fallax]KAH8944443.1 hypothetical protein BDL97_13G110700 [Sphagnum fallax]